MGMYTYLYCIDCDKHYLYGKNGYIFRDEEVLEGWSDFLTAHTGHVLVKQDNDCSDLWEFADPYYNPNLDKKIKKMKQLKFLEWRYLKEKEGGDDQERELK